MSAVAKSYWRTIQKGTRTFDSIPDNMKDEVRELARADMEAGLITSEDYARLIGE